MFYGTLMIRIDAISTVCLTSIFKKKKKTRKSIYSTSNEHRDALSCSKMATLVGQPLTTSSVDVQRYLVLSFF